MNGKRNMKENEKPVPYVLRLDSNNWQKELKRQRETNCLKIKTCFESLANGT